MLLMVGTGSHQERSIASFLCSQSEAAGRCFVSRPHVMARPLLMPAIFVGVLMLGHVVRLSASGDAPPYSNIAICLIDDFGYCDHEGCDSDMRTPNMNRMRQEGVTFNQSYVLQVCAPTRSAILTARYPYKYGMQVNQIKGANLAWLNNSLKLFPEYLRDYNYTTHKVGKWHLGECDWSLTPMWRGFDTDFGFYTNSLGYFNHSGQGPFSYDFRNQTDLFYDQGTYATDLYNSYIHNLITNRDKTKPFFLYYAMQNVHCPCEARQDIVDRYCSHIRNKERRTRCGMVWSADDSIGQIRDLLAQEGILDNTILLVLSDNGGPREGGGCNWPLRSQKSSLWEGGMRSFTILRSSKLNHTNVTFSGMIHAVDWLPTLMAGAGLQPNTTGLDGQNLWSQIASNTGVGRSEFVYNLEDSTDRYCIRWNQWKYCEGVPARRDQGWYPPPSMEASLASQIFSGNLTWGDINFGRAITRSDINSTLLMNIEEDPQEIYNRINDYPSLAAEMKKKLRQYKKSLFPYVKAEKAENDFIKYNATFGYKGPGWCNP